MQLGLLCVPKANGCACGWARRAAGVELAAVVAERLRGRARIKLITSTADILPQSPQVGGWSERGWEQWGWG